MKSVYLLDNMQLSTNQNIQRLIVSNMNMCCGKFLFVLVWIRFSVVTPWNKCNYMECKFPVISLTFLSLSQVRAEEGNNELGAAGPSGDFEIREDRRNDLGRGVVPEDPDLIGNTVDGGSSAAQLPQKNILERKEVLIGRHIYQLS